MNPDSNLTFSLPPELIQKYISRRFSDVDVCRSALKELDFPKVASLGHQMKGNGTNFGFPTISEIGAKLEAAAQKNDSGTVGEQLEQLQRFLQKILKPIE